MEYLYIGVMCSVATALFALAVGSKLKAAAISGTLGGVGFVIYMLLRPQFSEATTVFIATFTVCLSAELLARVLKTPSTVFSIPAILPLVPGVMLYRTLLHFGNGDTYGGLTGVVDTLIVAGSLSLAVTLAALIAKLIFKRKKTNEKNNVL